jgi:succinate dehydrogenase / fumarate reductase cytochrome b subunit
MAVLGRKGLSSLNSKYLMAVTGLVLIAFVLVHMAGNLLIFAGRGALNGYAHHLEELGPLLWVARIALLTVFVLHVNFGLRLWLQNRAARGRPYRYEDTLTASWASRHMLLTGFVLLAFIIFHLMHFTFGLIDPDNSKYTWSQVTPGQPLPPALTGRKAPDRPRPSTDDQEPAPKTPRSPGPGSMTVLSGALMYDLEANVVGSFQKAPFGVPWIGISYVLAQLFLGLHLWHGGSSWVQSLGLNRQRPGWRVHLIGLLLALIVVVGNCSIPIAIWLGWRPT